MQRKTYTIYCEEDDEALEFQQYCEDNHFFYDLINTTSDIPLFVIVFDKYENAHNKPVILNRYLKGKKMDYRYECIKY